MTDLSPASSADDRGSLSAQLRREDVLDAFEAAWRSGPRPALLAYLERVPADKRSGLLDELLSLDCEYRRQAGETPRVEDYATVLPQFLTELQMFFATRTTSKPSQTPSGPATRSGSDRNLLFGILALQMDFIGRDALVDALRDWTTQKDKPLGQILVERGDLSAARRALLEPLVDEHVRRHNNDPAASLASISSVVEGDVDWSRVPDSDISASLAIRRRSRNESRTEGAGSTPPREEANPALRFRVLRPHARGGIGEVFVALDQELNREVALKEIQSKHVRDESFRERFVREAEVTGGLEHPGIVPVYSLGHYDDGRPFYAMRFIRGDNLKEALEQFHAGPNPFVSVIGCDESNTPTVLQAGVSDASSPVAQPSERPSRASREMFTSVEFRKLLNRFIDVCQAIEYAHSRGVLHRDLKPGNIMLGKYGETLVVDWGLAKAAGKDDRFANVDEVTLVPASGSSAEETADGSVVGTPAYMSPEQAAGCLDQLGPATDVYSLGATLYHLLAGQAPFTSQPRRPGAAIAPEPQRQSRTEFLRRVQHGEFPRPREINSQIPKPLEAICLKAMSVLPADRYSSSSALAEDIEHWLADELVTAHRETTIDSASRWVRKHRAGAMSGAAAFVLVTVVSTVAGVWINSALAKVVSSQQTEALHLRNALRNEEEAQRQRILAEQETKRADEEAIRAKVSGELTSFMRELFTSSDPTGLTGSGLLPAGEGSRNATAVQLLEVGAKLMREKFQNPSRSDQLTRAAMVSAIGDVSRSLGLLNQSKPLLMEAFRIRQELLPADDKDIAASQFQLANWHTERGDFQEAEDLYSEVLAGHRRRGTLESVEAAEVQLRLSVLFISIGDSRSEQYARDGLATRETLLGARHRDTAIGRVVLAASLMDQQKTAEAITLGISAMESLISTHGLGNEKMLSSVLEYQGGLVLAQNNLHSLAIVSYRHAIELMKQILGPQHVYISMLLYDLGFSLRMSNQTVAAEAVFRECLDVVRNTVGIEHPRAVRLLAAYCAMLAELGRHEEGVSLINEALTNSEKRYGKAVPWRFRLSSVGVITAVDAKQYELASALGEEALASLEARTQPLSLEEGFSLANMAWKLGNLSDLTLCRKAYGRVFALNGRQNDLKSLWTDNLNFGGILAEHKFYLEAEPYLREAVRLTKTPEVRRIRDFGPMAFTLLCLGKVDWAAGRFAEAEANFRAALAEDKKAGSKAQPIDTLSRLINFLIVRQQFADAAPLVNQYGRIADLSAVNRAWHFYLQAALPEAAGTPVANKSVLVELEKVIGASTVPDVAMYRARAVVVGRGDTARELERLDALPQAVVDREGILMARTACALRLDQPAVALEALDRLKSPLEADHKSQLRMLLKALAVFRQAATDTHRNDLTAAVERAETYLESTKNLTTPEISGYAISNQVELRWWCQQIRHEWKGDRK